MTSPLQRGVVFYSVDVKLIILQYKSKSHTGDTIYRSCTFVVNKNRQKCPVVHFLKYHLSLNKKLYTTGDGNYIFSSEPLSKTGY